MATAFKSAGGNTCPVQAVPPVEVEAALPAPTSNRVPPEAASDVAVAGKGYWIPQAEKYTSAVILAPSSTYGQVFAEP